MVFYNKGWHCMISSWKCQIWCSRVPQNQPYEEPQSSWENLEAYASRENGGPVWGPPCTPLYQGAVIFDRFQWGPPWCRETLFSDTSDRCSFLLLGSDEVRKMMSKPTHRNAVIAILATLARYTTGILMRITIYPWEINVQMGQFTCSAMTSLTYRFRDVFPVWWKIDSEFC